MKACFKCGQEKPLDAFYAHPMMADKHLGKCKECAKADVMRHRQENEEKIRAYDRERGKLPHRKARTTEVNKRWRVGAISKAHNVVSWAVHTGRLVKEPCWMCQAPKSEAHHDDYAQPLNVMWLCTVCHRSRHVFLRYLKSQQEPF